MRLISAAFSRIVSPVGRMKQHGISYIHGSTPRESPNAREDVSHFDVYGNLQPTRTQTETPPNTLSHVFPKRDRGFGTRDSQVFIYSSRPIEQSAWRNKCRSAEQMVRAKFGQGLIAEFQRILELARGLHGSDSGSQGVDVRSVFTPFAINKDRSPTSLMAKWGIRCSLQYQDSQDRRTLEPLFKLSISLNCTMDICTVEPSSDWNSCRPEVILRLQPKSPRNGVFSHQALPMSDSEDHDVWLIATRLAFGFRQGVRGHHFECPASFLEATAMHIEKAFQQSPLSQHLQLEATETSLRAPNRSESSFRRIIHKHVRPAINHDASRNEEPVPVDVHENAVSTHQENTTKVAVTKFSATTQKAIGYQIIVAYLDDDCNQAGLSSGTLVDTFVTRCEESGLAGLAKIVYGASNMFSALPAPGASSICFEHLQSNGLSEAHCLTKAEPRKRTSEHSVRLKHLGHNGLTSISIRTDRTRKLSARLRDDILSHCRIEVTGLLLNLAPVESSTLVAVKDDDVKPHLSAAEEVQKLFKSAYKIMSQMCENVEFEDYATVPDRLAEAVLTAVRPLTPVLKIEGISLRFKQENGSVELERSAWVEGVPLADRALGTRDSLASLARGEFSRQKKTAVLIAYAKESRPTSLVQTTGFSCVSWRAQQAVSPPRELVPPTPATQERLEKMLDRFNSLSSLHDIACDIARSLHDVENFGMTFFRPKGHHALVVSSNGIVSIFSEPIVLTVGLGNDTQGPSGYYNLYWSCRGVPRPAVQGVSVKLQLEHMENTVKRMLDSHVSGKEFRDGEELVNRIMDAVEHSKDDFMKFLNVEYAVMKVAHGSGLELEEWMATRSMTQRALPLSPMGDDGTFHSESFDTDSDFESVNPGNHVISERRDSLMADSQQLDSGSEPGDPATTLKELIGVLDAQLAVARSPSSIEAEKSDLDSGPERDGSIACSDSSVWEATKDEDEPFTELQGLLQRPDPQTNRSMKQKNTMAKKLSPRMERGVVIALGSNVGNRIEEIEKACRAIDEDPDMRIVDTSCLYETEPMYVEDQGRFVNGACEIETTLTPLELLERLQAIEQGHGRVKLIDKGPRNIDLDIAIFRDEVIKTERLTVPHMLMHEREFVIRPIMDLGAMDKWEYPDSRRGSRLHDLGFRDFPPHKSSMDTITPLTASTSITASSPVKRTHVMSILNTTPDSFSDGGSNSLDPESLRATAAAHIAAGATIIDVGGQSSRPNAPDISAEEEIVRVFPAIAAIKSLPESEGIAISVDTYRAAVAEAAVNAGAHIVNDISAGMLDPDMLSTVARLGCTYVMMHMRGTPHTMQNPENCVYPGGVRRRVRMELNHRTKAALQAGIRRWRIIHDLGIGFAKTQEQNLALLDMGQRQNVMGRSTYVPHLVGTSRKRFIGNITGVDEPKDRVWGTAATVTAAICGGADIVRVHDVKEMAQVAKMADAIYRRGTRS